MKDLFVLIASNEFDRPTTEPVQQLLEDDHHCNTLTYEADQVAGQRIAFGYAIDENGPGPVIYGNRTFEVDDISSAWYRRPNTFGSDMEGDAAKRMCLDRERSLSQAFWDLIDDERWLNAPQAMRKAERKIAQLATAQSLGFAIPKTVISNDWSLLQHEFDGGEVIVKMPHGPLYTAEGVRIMYTQRLTDLHDPNLTRCTPCPGLWQPYMPGARQWRITTVGDELFPAAIYQSARAKHDWRQYQDVPTDVEFRAEPFPDEDAARCLKLKDELGLQGFATFDLAEQPDGQMMFFEVNPNGQFGWLEDFLDLPISRAIASRLATIAAATAVDYCWADVRN